jgi:hypothetical protein
MMIQFNTDKSVNGDQRQEEFFTSQIAEELNRYESHMTRIEVHLSNESGEKEGIDDIRCLIEARLKGRQPIAITNRADTSAIALSGATNKLRASLDTVLGRMSNH